MNQAPRLGRRARWAVPSGAVAAVGVVLAGTALTSAQAAPALPARTPAQLIAAIAANRSAPASLSGTIVTDAALGLPGLPGTGDPTSITSLLTGSHTIKIWYARPGKLRLALPVQLGETDLRVDGRQVWLWDSRTNTATHTTAPAAPAMRFAGHHRSLRRSAPRQWNALSGGIGSVPTPQQLAQRLLAAIGPTTAVSAASNLTVAGRAAYQLVLAPKNPASLIGRVAVAVDAGRYLPLRVQVFARGAASPAYQVGFTALSFARPAASNFTFTPPPGAKVKTVRPQAGPLAAFPPGAMPGGGGLIRPPRHMIMRRCTAFLFKGMPKAGITSMLTRRGRVVVGGPGMPLPTGSLTMNPLRAAMQQVRVGLPRHLSGSQRQRLLRMLRRDMARARRLHPGAGWQGAGWHGAGWQGAGWYGARRYGNAAPGVMFPAGVAGMPRVIGSGWTAVGVFPAAGLTAGPAGGVAGALLRSGAAVHGSWGSGRLLRTSLLSVLITSNGKALIGAVTPSVLYAAAAQAK